MIKKPEIILKEEQRDFEMENRRYEEYPKQEILENTSCSSCYFDHVVFEDSLTSFEFVDVIFDHCDFSNLTFQKIGFYRVEFHSCKFVGTSFIDTTFQDVSFLECVNRYGNFAKVTFTRVIFQECDLMETSFQEIDWKELSFEESNLAKAEFVQIKLKNLDLRTCEIQGIQLDPTRCSGLKLTFLQSAEIARLLGIDIF